MLQGELRENCSTWLERWAKSKPLHALSSKDRLQHHLDTADLLLEVRHMSSMVFGGALNKESTGLVFGVSNALRAMGNYPMGVRFCQAFIGKVRRGGNRLALANLLNIQGGNHIGLAQFSKGLTFLTESKNMFHEEGEDGLIFAGMVGMNIGNAFGYLRQYPESLKYHKEALQTLESIPEDWFERNKERKMDPNFCRKLILGNMGFAYMYRAAAHPGTGQSIGDHEAAAKAMTEAIEIEADPALDIHQRADLVQNEIFQGNLGLAQVLIGELHKKVAKNPDLASKKSLISFAEVELESARGKWTRAAKLCRKTLKDSLDTGDIITEYMVTERYLRILSAFVGHLKQKSGEEHGLFFLLPEGGSVLADITSLIQAKEALEDHDHSQMVADLAVDLGKALVASGGAQEGPLPELDGDWGTLVHVGFLKVAGLLHDIGKLRVPWSVLNFPGDPNPEEWAVLKNHVTETSTILVDLGLESLALVTADHHECPNGKGYPQGTRDLTMMGAILAVADSFVAGTTPRPGRLYPATVKEILTDILAGSGTRYDSRVCDVLTQVIIAR